MSQIESENLSLIGNGEPNGCTAIQIKSEKLSKIESEMLIKIESEQLSQIGNGESNMCSECQIKVYRLFKLN